jgi:hypothetical protein
MIGFENFSPSTWLDGIFVVRSVAAPRGKERAASGKRGGKWMNYVAVGAIGALVAGTQLELPFSIGVSSPPVVSRAKESGVAQDVARIRQGIADLRRQIRRGVLDAPDQETMALANDVAVRTKSRGLDRNWADEVAKSFLG